MSTAGSANASGRNGSDSDKLGARHSKLLLPSGRLPQQLSLRRRLPLPQRPPLLPQRHNFSESVFSWLTNYR